MSTTEPAPPIPPSATPPPPAPRRGRLRRFVIASLLLLTGGVIGAVVTSSSHGFGPGWRDGPHGWHYHERGWREGPGDFGGRMFFPGRIERGAERVLSLVDASTEQRQKVVGILNRAA